MKKNTSEDIAFFNLLKGLIAPTIGDESVNYKISINDLADKMEMDKRIISKFLSKLQENGLINVLGDVDDEVNLHFDKTHKKLLEIISFDGVEGKILTISDFIEKKSSYFDFNSYRKYISKYALEAKNKIEFEGSDADLRDIVSRGIREILSSDKNKNVLNRIIFEIAKDADEDDSKILEEIIYYRLNLPVEEDPFHVTLFLTVLSLELQYLQEKK